MKYYFLTFVASICLIGNAFCQEKISERKTYFSEQIYLYHQEYTYKAKRAYKIGKEEEAEELYKELLEKFLIGSYMDNFSANCLNKNKCCIDDYERPMVLMTYASWKVPSNGEVPALNAIAKKYRKKVDFVVLFWDQKEDVRKVAKKYNRHIHIIYVDELKNRDAHIVKMLKHSIGLPTSFLIASDKKIIDIQHNPQQKLSTPKKEAAENSLQELEQFIEQLFAYETKLN